MKQSEVNEIQALENEITILEKEVKKLKKKIDQLENMMYSEPIDNGYDSYEDYCQHMEEES